MLVGLTWLLPVSCLAAEELPPQAQVLLRAEPYAAYAAEEVPLPPTESQVAELPRHQFRERAEAMKAILYRGMARTRDARWRETEQNLATMAREALASSAAPPEFVGILELQAGGNLTRSRAYALRHARERLTQLYAVDELQMRLMLDYVDAAAEQAETILHCLPLQAVFNMVPQTPLSRERITADLHLYADIQTREAQVLSRVQTAEDVDAALPELKYLLLLHDTTLSTRALMLQGRVHPDSPEMEAAATALGKAAALLRGQRSRLDEQQWFGRKELQALDYLLN